MTVPDPHRSPKADPDLQWDWSEHEPRYTDGIPSSGGWSSKARAHAWYEWPPGTQERYKLPITVSSMDG